MKYIMDRTHFWRAGSLVLALVLGLAAGCKNQQPAARTDQQMSADVEEKISGEGALEQQNIQVSVANGVATLTGTVTDEASRALAGNDSGAVAGVKTVVNNLTVQAAQSAPPPAAQPPQQAPAEPRSARRSEPDKRHRDREKDEQPAPVPPSQVAEAAPPPPVQQTPPPPPPP